MGDTYVNSAAVYFRVDRFHWIRQGLQAFEAEAVGRSAAKERQAQPVSAFKALFGAYRSAEKQGRPRLAGVGGAFFSPFLKERYWTSVTQLRQRAL